MRERDGVADLDVVGKGDVLDLNIGRLPLVEEEESGVVGGDDVCSKRADKTERQLGNWDSCRAPVTYRQGQAGSRGT